MTDLTYQAARSGHAWEVTRSTTDTLGTARAAFVFDTTTVTSKLALKELWRDLLHKVSDDFGTVSKPHHLTGGAFDDAALFEDDTMFSDQNTFYRATLAANNAHTIARASDAEGSLGTADAVLMLASGQTKIELRSAINAIRRALDRDALATSKPSSYPTSGSISV